MCAMYKSAIWQFSNPPMKTTYEAMLSRTDADSFVIRSQDRSDNHSTEPTAKLIGQGFSMALCEEIHSRGFAAEQVAMQTVIASEKLPGGRNRIRLELDVIVRVPKATANELIDAVRAAKRRCATIMGRNIKILLKAELKMSKLENRSFVSPDSLSPRDRN